MQQDIAGCAVIIPLSKSRKSIENIRFATLIVYNISQNVYFQIIIQNFNKLNNKNL
jgi:hypothetical protein